MAPCVKAVSINHLPLEPFDVGHLELDHLTTLITDEMVMMLPVNDLLVLLETVTKVVLSNDPAGYHQSKRPVDRRYSNLHRSFPHSTGKIFSREMVIDREGRSNNILSLLCQGQIFPSEVLLKPINKIEAHHCKSLIFNRLYD